MKQITKLAAAAMLLTNASIGFAATPQQAASYIDNFVDQHPDLGPGYNLVVVSGNDVLLNKSIGVLKSNSPTPVTADAPMYIASQTKAYMGLLAAHLHNTNILKLSDPLSKYLPSGTLPEGVDATKWTLKDLLAHNVPISADYLTMLEAYVTEVSYKDYPVLLKQNATIRENGFEYSNLGYNIYGAILEQATGKSWKIWLDDVIFKPHRMTSTSANTSDYKKNNIAWNHIWLGKEKSWHQVPPKTDGMMQSAGGLMTTPNDMVKWLQLNLSNGKHNISSDDLALAHENATTIKKGDLRNYEMNCDGYSLGWAMCHFKSHRIYIHGGGYTGARSMMAFIPELNIGMAAFANSDNMTGRQSLRIFKQFVLFLIDDPKREEREKLRIDIYPKHIKLFLEHKEKRLAKANEQAHWENWQYKPNSQELAHYAGHYLGPDKYAKVTLKVDESQLKGQSFDYQFALKPASKNVFALTTTPLSVPEKVEFIFDDMKQITGFKMEGKVYHKQ